MALDTTSLAALLEALRNWLIDNPDGDIQEFADEHDVEVADLADGWQAYFAQADFSRNYDLGTDTTQAGAQGAVQAAPVYTPSEPPPYGSSPEVYHEYLTQEVNNYQEFTTVNNITNNIEDNSFNQQIIDSEVQQEIDIDNSDVEQGDNSVNIDESTLVDSPVNTGDVGRRWRAAAGRRQRGQHRRRQRQRRQLGHRVRRRHHRRQRQRQLRRRAERRHHHASATTTSGRGQPGQRHRRRAGHRRPATAATRPAEPAGPAAPVATAATAGLEGF